MTKQEVAVEILKLCAKEIITQEFRGNQNQSDYAGRLAEAYNAIYKAISDPKDGK